MDRKTARKTLIKLIQAANDFQDAADALKKEGIEVCGDFRNGYCDERPPRCILMNGVDKLAEAIGIEQCMGIGYEEYTAYGQHRRSLILGDWELKEILGGNNG